VQNPLCAARAAAVLAGLAVTAASGWDWLDPAIAVALAAVAVREGVTTWRGTDCC
jgi:divalent metal cation (Fe/Co/Zn/Cd) transporter